MDRGPRDGSQGGGGINFRGNGSRLESRRSPHLGSNPLCCCHPDGFYNHSHHPAAPGKKAWAPTAEYLKMVVGDTPLGRCQAVPANSGSRSVPQLDAGGLFHFSD